MGDRLGIPRVVGFKCFSFGIPFLKERCSPYNFFKPEFQTLCLFSVEYTRSTPQDDTKTSFPLRRTRIVCKKGNNACLAEKSPEPRMGFEPTRAEHIGFAVQRLFFLFFYFF